MELEIDLTDFNVKSDPSPPYVPAYTIVCDTREQRPYSFVGIRKNINGRSRAIQPTVVRQTLHTGDYSILHLESAVCVERKSLEDFVGTLTAGRERFAREMERMTSFRMACVVVEANLTDIMHWNRSRVAPLSLLNTVICWTQRKRVPWFFVGNRADAEYFTFWYLEKAYNEIIKQSEFF